MQQQSAVLYFKQEKVKCYKTQPLCREAEPGISTFKPKIICQALHSKAFIVPRWYFLLFPFAKISEILFTRAGKYNLHLENKMMKYFGQREPS